MNKIQHDQTEIFAAHSDRWWDENGPFRPLHRLNPARLEYILSQTGDIQGKTVLDIGCGGGLVCEPLARLGAKVTGIDLTPEAIDAAKAHSASENLDITYRNIDLKDIKEKFDVVLALEVIEHVANPQEFITEALKKLNNDGIIVFSTLNRTVKSLILGKYAAEYIFGWVPAGTHDWRRFIRPSELGAWLRQSGRQVSDVSGLSYRPLSRDFALSKTDTSINYFITAR